MTLFGDYKNYLLATNAEPAKESEPEESEDDDDFLGGLF